MDRSASNRYRNIQVWMFNSAHESGLKETEMSIAQKLLLETLAGHFALLEANCPKKAQTQRAKKAKECVMRRLRQCERAHLRRAA
jgi:hypothetical protein